MFKKAVLRLALYFANSGFLFAAFVWKSVGCLFEMKKKLNFDKDHNQIIYISVGV